MRPAIIVIIALVSGMALAGSVSPVEAQNYKQIYSFSGGQHGSQPRASLTEYRGKLFGTFILGGLHSCQRGDCGGVFSVNLMTGREAVVYDFQDGNDGQQPLGDNLISMNGLLYGTTYIGGANLYGTVFSVDPSTHSEKVLYSFQGGTDGGYLLGDGLIGVLGTLYGVTSGGGDNGNDGTVFSVDATTGAEKVLYRFQSGADGSGPNGSLIEVNGILYGATQKGGMYNKGTVFSVDPATGSERLLHSSGQTKDGSLAGGSLIKVGNKLYGITGGGGIADEGTVFSIDLASDKEEPIYSFTYSAKGNPNDGKYPNNGLTDIGGILYGTTAQGGAGNAGTVFAINLATKAETILYAFQAGTDGNTPLAGMINVHGTLYGTTAGGGPKSDGTVFSITP